MNCFPLILLQEESNEVLCVQLECWENSTAPVASPGRMGHWDPTKSEENLCGFLDFWGAGLSRQLILRGLVRD